MHHIRVKHRRVAYSREMAETFDNHEFAGERVNVRIGINRGTVVAGAVGAEGRHITVIE